MVFFPRSFYTYFAPEITGSSPGDRKWSPRERSSEMRNRQKGFSMIELLIVVAIVLVIAVIAIPSLIRSRLAANESSAVATLQTVNTALISYAMVYGNAYPPDLNSLRIPPGGAPVDCGVNGAGLLDDVLAGVSAGTSRTLPHCRPRLTNSRRLLRRSARCKRPSPIIRHAISLISKCPSRSYKANMMSLSKLNTQNISRRQFLELN